MRVLISDDDPLLRNVLRSVAKTAGHEVIAETDHASTAIELIKRYAPDIVVTDIPVADGGDAILREAAASAGPCRVVVFTSAAVDADALLAAGAAAVVEKPQFDRLESTLAIWAMQGRERRRVPAARDTAHPIVRSPSGLEDGRDFYEAVTASQPGDALLVLQLDDHESLVEGWGDVIAGDWVLHLARLTRAAVRDEDHLACFDGRRVHALLSGAGPDGVSIVTDRVTSAWRKDLGPAAPRFRHSWSSQDGSTTAEQLLEAAANAAGGAG